MIFSSTNNAREFRIFKCDIWVFQWSSQIVQVKLIETVCLCWVVKKKGDLLWCQARWTHMRSKESNIIQLACLGESTTNKKQLRVCKDGFQDCTIKWSWKFSLGVVKCFHSQIFSSMIRFANTNAMCIMNLLPSNEVKFYVGPFSWLGYFQSRNLQPFAWQVLKSLSLMRLSNFLMDTNLLFVIVFA